MNIYLPKVRFFQKNLMKISICAAIFTILPYVNGLLCNGLYTSLRIRIMYISIREVEEWLMKNLVQEEHYICHIEIQIEHPELIMDLYLTNVATGIPAINGVAKLSTIIRYQDKIPTQVDILEHSCMTHDYCEMDFLIKHIHWFVNDGYQKSFINNSYAILPRTMIALSNYIIN